MHFFLISPLIETKGSTSKIPIIAKSVLRNNSTAHQNLVDMIKNLPQFLIASLRN